MYIDFPEQKCYFLYIMCAPYVEARPEGGARAEEEIGEKV